MSADRLYYTATAAYDSDNTHPNRPQPTATNVCLKIVHNLQEATMILYISPRGSDKACSTGPRGTKETTHLQPTHATATFKKKTTIFYRYVFPSRVHCLLERTRKDPQRYSSTEARCGGNSTVYRSAASSVGETTCFFAFGSEDSTFLPPVTHAGEIHTPSAVVNVTNGARPEAYSSSLPHR